MNFERLETRAMLAVCTSGWIDADDVFELGDPYVRYRLMHSPDAERESVCNVQGDMTIDFGDGTGFVRPERVGHYRANNTENFSHTYVMAGEYLVTLDTAEIHLEHTITIKDWIPEFELKPIEFDLDDTSTGTSISVRKRLGFDVLEITSVFSLDTNQQNTGRYGTLTVSDLDLVYEFTDLQRSGFGYRTETFLVGICDDELNCGSHELIVKVHESNEPVIIIGDLNGDERVDNADRDLFFADYQDVDLDGDVDSDDVDWMRGRFRIPIGDVNLDGRFNSTDLIILFQAGRFETNLRATWSSGDFNADDRFNSSDLIAAFTEGSYAG